MFVVFLSTTDKWTSCESQEVQIKGGTGYFLERWAVMVEIRWHKEFNKTEVYWVWELEGEQAALACDKGVLLHSYSMSG